MTLRTPLYNLLEKVCSYTACVSCLHFELSHIQAFFPLRTTHSNDIHEIRFSQFVKQLFSRGDRTRPA